MEAITVLPSLARPRSVCVTKNADELHKYTTAEWSVSSVKFYQQPASCPTTKVPVKAAGGLVEEEEARAHEELERDADTALLTAADPAEVPVANDSVGAVLEAHFDDGALHERTLVLPRHLVRQPQQRRVAYRLPHRQRPDQVVVLRHVSLHKHKI